MPTPDELLAAYPPGSRTPLERALVEEVERLRAEMTCDCGRPLTPGRCSGACDNDE